MRVVFADTLYWVAIARPKDQWKAPALEAKRKLGDVIIRAIINNPNVKVVPQTRDGFLKGLGRYENRPDKNYSLTDCTSMNVLETEGIRDVLTHDHHFQQEGFTVLIAKNDR